MKQETGRIDRFFQVSQNHSSVRTEVLAGITTFITIAYILILNPQILADPYVIMGDAAMAGKIANGVFIGTCIGAFIGTIPVSYTHLDVYKRQVIYGLLAGMTEGITMR